MKAIQIHGKDYVPVVERVKEFRNLYPKGTIETEIKDLTEDHVLILAIIMNEDGKALSTGHAYEEKKWGQINARSMVENCETSAVGRALAFLGIGITDDIASADEMKDVGSNDIGFQQVQLIETLLEKANIGDKERNKIEAEMLTFTQPRAAKCIDYLKGHQQPDGSAKSIQKEMDLAIEKDDYSEIPKAEST